MLHTWKKLPPKLKREWSEISPTWKCHGWYFKTKKIIVKPRRKAINYKAQILKRDLFKTAAPSKQLTNQNEEKDSWLCYLVMISKVTWGNVWSARLEFMKTVWDSQKKIWRNLCVQIAYYGLCSYMDDISDQAGDISVMVGNIARLQFLFKLLIYLTIEKFFLFL